MKLKKFKLKNILMISMLAVAGLFGVCASVTTNAAKENNEFEKLEAVTDGEAITEEVYGKTYRVIYYHIATKWETSLTFYYSSDTDGHCYRYTTTDNSTWKYCFFGSGIPGDESYAEIIGDYTAKIFLPLNANYIIFQSSKNADGSPDDTTNSRVCGTATITSSSQAFVETTEKWGYWGYDGQQDATPKTYSEFMSYLHTNYFTIKSNWGGGNNALSTCSVFCNRGGGDYDRSTPITKAMLHQFKNGTYYAIFLAPATSSFITSSNYLQLVNANKSKATSQTIAANKLYTVTGSGGSSYTELWDDNCNYYLVGSGSFVNGEAWLTTSGVKLSAHPDYGSVLYHQYLEAGDAFTICSSDYASVYTYANIDSESLGTDYFVQAKKANLQCTIGNYYDNPTYTFWHEYSGADNVYTPSDQGIEVYVNRTDAPSWYGNDYGQPAFYTYDGSESHYFYGTEVGPTGYKWQQYKYTVNFDDIEKYQVFRTFNEDHSGTSNWSSDQTNLVNFDYIYLDCKVQTYKPFYVKRSGYYDITLSGGEVLIEESCNFDMLYLDVSNVTNNWTVKVSAIGAHFWKDGYDSNDKAWIKMNKVEGSGNNYLYEVKVPTLQDGMPDRVIFYGTTEFRPYEMNQWSWTDGYVPPYWTIYDKTDNLVIDSTYNVYTISTDGSKSSQKNYSSGSWTSLITNEQRAQYYGNYVLSSSGLVCYNTESMPTGWSSIYNEYINLHKKVQDIVWLSETTGSDALSRAMARYDLVVSKYGTEKYPDFIERSHDGSGSTLLKVSSNGLKGYNPFMLYGESDISVVLIIIASSISLISITALSVLLVKKRKKSTISK